MAAGMEFQFQISETQLNIAVCSFLFPPFGHCVVLTVFDLRILIVSFRIFGLNEIIIFLK